MRRLIWNLVGTFLKANERFRHPIKRPVADLVLPQPNSTHLGVGIACVVFSKDRPLQLDATLRSLYLNCADLALATIRVLYATSSPSSGAQYHVLATEHPKVAFVREEQFKADLLELIQDSEYVMFLVDDTLFVGPLSLAEIVTVLHGRMDCLGFSLRLGRNTTYCYTSDKPQTAPTFSEVGPGLLTFDWTGSERDFGYPIEVSSSIYRVSDVLPLLRDLDYRNPNTLESALAAWTPPFKGTRPRLACCETSVAFSVPANLTQTAWHNRAGRNPKLTTESLVQAFSDGLRLDATRYQGLVARACHQEVEFVFTTKDEPHA